VCKFGPTQEDTCNQKRATKKSGSIKSTAGAATKGTGDFLRQLPAKGGGTLYMTLASNRTYIQITKLGAKKVLLCTVRQRHIACGFLTPQVAMSQ
jgi:hypothetical protein